MEAKKKRLTLDMDPAFQRRLKATAALKGVSMRQYCLTAIDRELDKDEVNADEQPSHFARTSEQSLHDELTIYGVGDMPASSTDSVPGEIGNGKANSESDNAKVDKSERFKIGELMALRDEISRGKVFSSNSVELLREAREIRAKEMEGWA